MAFKKPEGNMKTTQIAWFVAIAIISQVPVAYADDGCPEKWSYAVEEKLYGVFGQNLTEVESLTTKELGDRHWKLGRLLDWAASLPEGCYRREWISWIDGLNEMIETEDAYRKGAPRPAEDTQSESRAMEDGLILSRSMPSPPGSFAMRRMHP